MAPPQRQTTGGLRPAAPHPSNHECDEYCLGTADLEDVWQFEVKASPATLKEGEKEEPAMSNMEKDDLVDKASDMLAAIQDPADPMPLSIEELVVIALVLNLLLTQNEIYAWILKSFAYFHNRGSHAVYHKLRSELERRFQSVMRDYYLPIYYTKNGLVSANEDEARFFLRRFFTDDVDESPHPPHKPFRLFDLPPELRNRIFEYVVAYPSSGVEVFRDLPVSKLPHLCALTRDFEDKKDMIDWTYPESNALINIGSLQEILSFSLVNRQFRHEVSTNNFVFDNLLFLFKCLESMPAFHRQHIKRISFVLDDDPGQLASAPAVFACLREMQNLQELEIYLGNSKWFDGFPDSVEDIPSLVDILRIRKLKKIICVNEGDDGQGEVVQRRQTMLFLGGKILSTLSSLSTDKGEGDGNEDAAG